MSDITRCVPDRPERNAEGLIVPLCENSSSNRIAAEKCLDVESKEFCTDLNMIVKLPYVGAVVAFITLLLVYAIMKESQRRLIQGKANAKNSQETECPTGIERS